MRFFDIIRTRFRPSLSWSILALCGILLLSSLGIWQLHRADEKKSLQEQAAKQAHGVFQVWEAHAKVFPARYQRITLQGHYLPMTLLLDNQYDNHQWGYHVLNLLELASGQVVMVDRGWVLGDIQRQQLPSITVPRQWMIVKGQVDYPSEKGILLGDWMESQTERHIVIERIDIKSISNLLHKKVYPFIIRLDQSAPFGYARHWVIISMPPERHEAYAFQWFAMALVLLIIYFSLSLK